MPTKVYPIKTQPGIKRDGTQFEGNFYVDGQWTRFQRGKPRKMGGFRQITDALTGATRGIFVSSADGINTIHAGSSSKLQTVQVDGNAYGAGVVDRTPAAYAADSRVLWQFDSMWDAAGGNTIIIAHPGYNLNAIDNTIQSPIYYGTITATAALTALGQSTAGCVAVVPPFLFIGDAGGSIAWSDANLPLTFTGGASGSARIAATKIVKGMVTRGATGYSPSAVFWSLDAVIQASFVGSPAEFSFNTISDQTSVLSSSGIIEYDGVFFWPGVDRFLVYSGTVQEIPNQLNANFFFDNLNWQYRQKVYAFKIPRYGEIWWCFPKGDSTECNWAVVYNLRENCWYDTALPATRTCAHFAQVMHMPIMAGTHNANGYAVWVHEVGTDKVVNQSITAVQAYIETSDITFAANGPDQQQNMGVDRWARVSRVEPDFVQSGDMTMTVRGRKYARSDDDDTPYVFSDTQEKIDVRAQRRELRLKFESNTVGGNFQMGEPLIHLDVGDGRQ